MNARSSEDSKLSIKSVYTMMMMMMMMMMIVPKPLRSFECSPVLFSPFHCQERVSSQENACP
jgi:hypothetical protein